MKNRRIFISVTYNGYVVENPDKDRSYCADPHSDTWTFESMKKLQERLPEILEIPVEKRAQTKQ